MSHAEEEAGSVRTSGADGCSGFASALEVSIAQLHLFSPQLPVKNLQENSHRC
ncbi:hypothetical protein JCM19037_4534 [Geomicrobium sp. JCM 19037]|nr:hypothetical protein JCM19037_4534 [Geomicrobium sp. JCM 19037]